MIVFYICATLLIILSFRSFRGGLDYLRFFKSELAKPRPNFTPFATVIAPCRGLDKGLRENLLALIEQDYPDYEIVFVVDDKKDAAVPVIEEISRKAAKNAKLIIAPKADGCSQKVENLREAVLHTSDESQIFVFVDSDARPSPDWLRYLVAPLNQQNVGAATGYRWFISENPSFASELRVAWNASIASALGPNTKTNFCWGGSMAVRRDVFDQIAMREKWRGTLSDDFAVTRAMNEAGLEIVFVPQALTASVEDCSFGEMLEFTTRQMKITRVYAPHLWLLSFFGSGLFISTMKAAFLIEMFRQTTDFAVLAAIATIVLVSIFSIGKAWLRLEAVKLVLTKYTKQLNRQFWPQITFWLITPALFFFNSFAALLSRRMTWRGITYELKSPTETVIIAD
jgi:ceramide glucosyltransferase